MISHTNRRTINPEMYIPKFHAKFGVTEGEPDGPRLGLPSDPVSIPLPLKYPTPYGFPMGGVGETRKAPSNEGASFIFGAGQKKSAFSSF